MLGDLILQGVVWGSFLFDKICSANHVKYEINIMDDIRVINDKKYSSFKVSMYFV